VTLLTAVDPKNIIDLIDPGNEQSTTNTSAVSSILPSSYSFRNRKPRQSRLMYDVRYHPMDDSIQPSQASKRRSAHGEIQLFSDDVTESSLVYTGLDIEDEVNDGETEKAPEPIRKRKKRARSYSQSSKPIRRSSRKTKISKVSYNMNIHPQDNDLELSSTNDGSDDDNEAPLPHFRRKKSSRAVPKKSASRLCNSKHPKLGILADTPDTIEISSDVTGIDNEHICHNRKSCEYGEEMIVSDKRSR
jgi:hypothetical protein